MDGRNEVQQPHRDIEFVDDFTGLKRSPKELSYCALYGQIQMESRINEASDSTGR